MIGVLRGEEMRGFRVSWYSCVKDTGLRRLALCVIAHRVTGITTKEGIELAFGGLCRRPGKIRSGGPRQAGFGANALSEYLRIVFDPRLVTDAGLCFKARAVEDIYPAAGIADEIFPLQGARGDGYRAPLHPEHVGQELVG